MNFSNKHTTYNEAAAIQAKVARWTSAWIPMIGDLPGPPVEFGAGTGLFTGHLLKKFGNLVATDLSARMLQEGRRHYPEARWETLNAWKLPTGKEYGGMFSTSLLQWCGSPEDVLSQWYAHLLPGGWMLHSFFIKGSLGELASVAPECLALEFLDEEGWRASFEAAGFVDIQTESREDRQTYHSAVEVFRNLHNLGATNPGQVPPAQLGKAIRKYDRKYKDGVGVPATWRSARVLCRRG